MADIATPAAAAASGLFYGSVVAVGVPPDLALPVALAAAVGASMALSKGSRIEFRARELMAAAVAFAFSWWLGAFGGPAAFSLLEWWKPDLAVKMPKAGILLISALLIAAYGQSHMIPWLWSKRPGGSNAQEGTKND